MAEAPKLGSIVRLGVWKYFGGLVMEDRQDTHVISIGRTSFLVVFSIMLWHWVAYRGQVPVVPLADGLLEAFFALLGYIASGKVAQAIRTRRNGGTGDGENSGPCAG